MIVWSGRGFLSVIVLVVALFASISLLPKEFGDYAFVISTFLAGIFSWILGNKWNNKNARTVIDEETGKRFVLKNNHSLFWIKMEYWGPIFISIGIVILAQNSIIAAVISGVALLAFIGYQFKNKKKTIVNIQENKSPKEKPIISNRDVLQLNPDKEKKDAQKEDAMRFMPK